MVAKKKKVPKCLQPLTADELSKLPSITEKEIKELLRKGARLVEKSMHQPEQKLLEGVCVVCQGKILETRWAEQDGPVIYGPGNRSYTRSRLNCTDCGLLYQHLPKKIRKK